MNQKAARAKAYLKEGCPYSFEYLLFMAEAGLLDCVEAIRCDPDSLDFEATTDMLAAATGKAAMFPTVEIEPGRYLSRLRSIDRILCAGRKRIAEGPSRVHLLQGNGISAARRVASRTPVNR
jgi:hypothetical protein